MQNFQRSWPLFLIWVLSWVCGSFGQGMPNLRFNSNEVFKPISTVVSNGGHGTVMMHKGYMVIIYAPDGGQRGGGISFWDISDPRNPVPVFDKKDSVTNPIREPHGWGIKRDQNKYYSVLQAVEGLQFWDWSDIQNPEMLNYLKLPGIIESDYDNGVWWTCWQGEYLYAGGSSNGLYVVNAKDPANPEYIKTIPTSQTGGFRIGPIFAIGNLLYFSNMDTDQNGFAIMDISDPENPALISTSTQAAPPGYSSLVNGNRFYAIDEWLGVYDVSDPTQFVWLGQSEHLGNKGGYATIQDGYIHMGSSSAYSKIDVRGNSNFTRVGTGTSGLADRDEDFGSVLGNLVMVGDDHSVGSALMPHQSEPDNTGPEVNMIVPFDSAVNQALTSRIGMTFTDNVDLESVDLSTIIVRPVGGEALVGTYTHQTAIVNFSPDEPLELNTTYEVVVPAGGVEDWSGNSSTQNFKSVFSTGDRITTGVKDSFSNRRIGIKQNAKGLYVHFSHPFNTGVQVVALNGAVVSEFQTEGELEFFVPKSNFSSGVYLIRLVDNGMVQYNQIFIIP